MKQLLALIRYFFKFCWKGSLCYRLLNKMKKFSFFIITVSITAIIFELMSFTVLKVYKKIYVSKIEKKYKKVNLENGSRRDYHQYHAFYGWKKKI